MELVMELLFNMKKVFMLDINIMKQDILILLLILLQMHLQLKVLKKVQHLGNIMMKLAIHLVMVDRIQHLNKN